MSRSYGNKEFWLSALRADGSAFRRAAGAPGALAAVVPSCPGWTVEDLVRHLGTVYRWVRSHASRGVTSPAEPRTEPGDDVPTGPAALAWWDDEHAALLGMLDTLDPEMPAWNWAPQPKKTAFWHRRMAHETAVHRWDAQMAIGLAEPIETKLAVDGVAEVLDTWLPGGRRRGPLGRLGVTELAATDIAESWFVRLRGERGIALLDTDTLLGTDDPPARVLVQGTASDLVLALYGRVPFEVLDVTGDATLLECLRVG